VEPLDHTTLARREEAGGVDAADGFRFAVLGDQRALADGEWQDLVARLAERAKADPRLLLVIDTGDIVNSGKHTDQFGQFTEVLAPLREVPYWITAGNHELDNNRSPRAREEFARVMQGIDPTLSPDRLYYERWIGPVRFLVLDTNDLIYGERGEGGGVEPAPGSRAEAQMAWLVERLAETGADGDGPTVACLHHPFLQSSSKHLPQARRLWSYRYQGRTLPEILLEGGVDLVLTGHTHTYERFLLRDGDGRELTLINVSGRPRNGFLWFGAGARRARDLRGEEIAWFSDHGFTGLEGWTVIQEDAMVEDEANQFAVVEVTSAGGVTLEMNYLDPEEPEGLRTEAAVPLFPRP
jgi:hypothetical protein